MQRLARGSTNALYGQEERQSQAEPEGFTPIDYIPIAETESKKPFGVRKIIVAITMKGG
jgi:hypothetical protein